MSNFVKIYMSLLGLSLAASGYWYVDAYFSFFGMEEVINELGVNYYIQKSSVIFSTLLSPPTYLDSVFAQAYSKLIIWLVISGVFYWLLIPVKDNTIRLGSAADQAKQETDWGRAGVSIVRLRAGTPLAVAILFVGMPFFGGIHGLSTALGEEYAWKLVSKDLPYYSQVTIPELALIREFDGVRSDSATKLIAIQNEIRIIGNSIGKRACQDLSGHADDKFDSAVTYTFPILQSHFVGAVGAFGPILLEVYRTDRWIYLTTVMTSRDEPHFLLRINPKLLGSTQTQIVPNSNSHQVPENIDQRILYNVCFATMFPDRV